MTIPKVIFYDFDNTLCLWKLSPLAKLEYEKSVKDILQHQENEGIIRIIVSTSALVHTNVASMNLEKHFDAIHSVKEPLEKISCILDILKDRKLSPTDALYFDDDVDCVVEARK